MIVYWVGLLVMSIRCFGKWVSADFGPIVVGGWYLLVGRVICDHVNFVDDWLGGWVPRIDAVVVDRMCLIDMVCSQSSPGTALVLTSVHRVDAVGCMMMHSLDTPPVRVFLFFVDTIDDARIIVVGRTPLYLVDMIGDDRMIVNQVCRRYQDLVSFRGEVG